MGVSTCPKGRRPSQVGRSQAVWPQDVHEVFLKVSPAETAGIEHSRKQVTSRIAVLRRQWSGKAGPHDLAEPGNEEIPRVLTATASQSSPSTTTEEEVQPLRNSQPPIAIAPSVTDVTVKVEEHTPPPHAPQPCATVHPLIQRGTLGSSLIGPASAPSPSITSSPQTDLPVSDSSNAVPAAVQSMTSIGYVFGGAPHSAVQTSPLRTSFMPIPVSLASLPETPNLSMSFPPPTAPSIASELDAMLALPNRIVKIGFWGEGMPLRVSDIDWCALLQGVHPTRGYEVILHFWLFVPPVSASHPATAPVINGAVMFDKRLPRPAACRTVGYNVDAAPIREDLGLLFPTVPFLVAGLPQSSAGHTHLPASMLSYCHHLTEST
ncbi:hypothetical protein LXA43DRAFT_1067460 [Ganoderma leucocontextum]|nr:hypothetical protein LXA43DRAFT_1067460 [Ganoderma leucocontextum]